jgi:predicted phosphoribosyltransferase
MGSEVVDPAVPTDTALANSSGGRDLNLPAVSRTPAHHFSREGDTAPVGSFPHPVLDRPLFTDHRDGGRALASVLKRQAMADPIVVGIARAGVEVAAEVARALDVRLDVVVACEIGHPFEPDYTLGAVTPDGSMYVTGPGGLTEEQFAAMIERTRMEAIRIDKRLHAQHPALDLRGKAVLIVADRIAAGATIMAALRWARMAGAARTVACAPLGKAEGVRLLQGEADDVVCAQPLSHFFAAIAEHTRFAELDEDAIRQLISENRQAHCVPTLVRRSRHRSRSGVAREHVAVTSTR